MGRVLIDRISKPRGNFSKTMDLSKAIRDVNEAAQADTTGTGQSHVDLLEAVRRLNLAAETPAETLMRMRFEVF